MNEKLETTRIPRNRTSYNKAYYIARKAELDATNKARCREWRANNRKKFREALLTRLGGVCKVCGFSDPRALQIDHIHGGGCAEIRASYREAYYKRLLALSDTDLHADYQLLCANHNWIKRYEEKEHLRKSEC